MPPEIHSIIYMESYASCTCPVEDKLLIYHKDKQLWEKLAQFCLDHTIISKSTPNDTTWKWSQTVDAFVIQGSYIINNYSCLRTSLTKVLVNHIQIQSNKYLVHNFILLCLLLCFDFEQAAETFLDKRKSEKINILDLYFTTPFIGNQLWIEMSIRKVYRISKTRNFSLKGQPTQLNQQADMQGQIS